MRPARQQFPGRSRSTTGRFLCLLTDRERSSFILMVGMGRCLPVSWIQPEISNWRLARRWRLLPGKYLVTVAVSLLHRSPTVKSRTSNSLRRRSTRRRNSDLTADVKPGANQINFDLTSRADEAGATSQESPKAMPATDNSDEKK